MNKKTICKAASIVLILLMLTGCSSISENPNESYSVTVYAMDTVMELTVYGNQTILNTAESLIFELDSKLSVTNAESDIYKVNHEGGGTICSEAYELLNQALELCKRTDGALDVSIYPVVEAWGFTTDEYRVPTDDELHELLRSVDHNSVDISKNGRVELAPGMMIDLGSVAKGYTANRLVKLLSENGVKSALLNLGGNVHVLGTKPDGALWKIAVADPAGDGYVGVIEAADKAIVTSGEYERFFEQDGVRYHHIIDPATGHPADNGFLSVTIVGNDGVLCDALSTALFVMGSDKAAEFWKESDDFEAIFIASDEIMVTEGLEDAFSPIGAYNDMKLTILHRD